MVSDLYEKITEIRPGNYVFLDLTALRLGVIDPDRILYRYWQPSSPLIAITRSSTRAQRS